MPTADVEHARDPICGVLLFFDSQVRETAASTVVLASGTGLPISTTHTHTLVGAVLGVGLARGISALNLGVIRTIFMSWVLTLPVGAGLAVIFYYILRASLL